MDVNINAPSINLTMTANSMSADFGTQAIRDPMFNIAHLNGKMTVGVPALTKRVADGTQILNQLWADRTLAQVGFALDSGRFYIYTIYGYFLKDGQTQETYMLNNTPENVTDAEFELTFETAPKKPKLTSQSYYKARLSKSLTTNPQAYDARLCRIIYDADGNEVERLYSAQYRYLYSDGVLTRTRFITQPTSAKDIIEIGLRKNENSAGITFNAVGTGWENLLPLVSTLQTAQYSFILPDDLFTDAPYGYQIVARAGDETCFSGSTVFKAENAMTLFSPNGTEYKITVDNSGVLTASPAS